MSSAELTVFIDKIKYTGFKKSVNKTEGIFCAFLPEWEAGKSKKLRKRLSDHIQDGLTAGS